MYARIMMRRVEWILILAWLVIAGGMRPGLTGPEQSETMCAEGWGGVPIVGADTRMQVEPRLVAEGDDEIVGWIGGTDGFTRVHVTNLLRVNGVKFFMGGSVEYGVYVPRGEVGRARYILREDSKARGYEMRFPNEPVRAQPAQEWSQLVFLMPVQEARRAVKTRGALDIGKLLEHATVRTAARRYSFLSSIHFLRREYLDADGQFKNGYVVYLDLYMKGDGTLESPCRIWVEAYQEGRLASRFRVISEEAKWSIGRQE